MDLKKDLKIEDLLELHHNMYQLIGFAKWYCKDRSLGKCVLTSLISDRKNVEDPTDVHGDGRGVDIRIWGWSAFEKNDFCNLANEKFKSIAAVSLKTGQLTAAVLEDDHIHMQCRP